MICGQWRILNIKLQINVDWFIMSRGAILCAHGGLCALNEHIREPIDGSNEFANERRFCFGLWILNFGLKGLTCK